MQHYSEFKQDIFAIKNAKNKTYIEIGAGFPIKKSNTFLLENNGWKGISIELNKNRFDLWKTTSERKNKIYFEDAITFDYISALKENDLGTHIGYLSCDINPPKNTFLALKQVIEQGISFDCITFEHDKYQSHIDIEPEVINYLNDYGYSVAVNDVYRWRKYRININEPKIIKKCFLETWFIKNDLFTNSINYEEWINAHD